MMKVDKSKPVLVTGATGYVAGRVVERLLQEGLTVHATVRDASKTERYAYLTELGEALPGNLEFFSADLTKEGSFDEAMKGCGVVFHIASPFALTVKDAQKELIDPAVGGTRNVLEAVERTESVSRVVLTSSCAAIFTDNQDVADAPGGILTEDVWNTTATLDYNPYSLSKTLAEKEAWKIHDAQSRWSLVTMNPPMVMGPGVRIHGSSESFLMLKRMGDGTDAMGTADFPLGIVDVRDLAEAHVRAAFTPEASGRNIISGHDSGFPEMARILRARFPNHPIPKRVLPRFAVVLFGPMLQKGASRTFFKRSIGIPWKADNSKSRRELGMTYRPLEETLGDFFQQMIDEGVLTAK